MNTPSKHTGFLHRKGNGIDAITNPLSNLQQKDQFCVGQGGKAQEKRKNWIDGMGQDSDQSYPDCQSLLGLQSDLLESHKMVLQNLLSKNQVLLSKYSQIIIQQFPSSKQNSNPIFKTLRMQQYLALMLAKLRKFKPALVAKFECFFETEKYFYKFLLHVYHSFSDIVVAKAMKLIFFIWELYVPYHKKKMQLKNVQTLSCLISNTICENEFKFAKKEILADHAQRECYGQMIQTLAMTVLLVIQECSHNPYSDVIGAMSESAGKAQMIEGRKLEEQCLDVCRKKVKGQSPNLLL